VTHRIKAWLADKRGAYDLIQFALLLPIFVVILYGSFEIYKLVSIRQSLDTGTYQAARYLSVYHKYYFDSRYNRTDVDHSARAERLIWDSMRANGFVSGNTPLQIAVRYYNGAGQQITTPADFPCKGIRDALSYPDTSGLIFTVRSQATLPWQASVLGIPMGSITLSSAHTAFVDCGPWHPHPPATPTPTPTPTVTPQPAPGG
jgi:hypothetical protein